MQTLYKQLTANLLGELVLNNDYTGYRGGSRPTSGRFFTRKTQTWQNYLIIE